MNLTNWKRSYRQLKTEAGITRISLAGCAVALALLSFNAINKSTTVVIQPFGMQKTGWVSENNASQSYKEAWGLSLAQLLGNVSPGNLDFVKQRIIPLLPANLYEQTVTNMTAEVIMMKENRVTTSFDPLEVVYERDTDKVFVYGNYSSQSPAIKAKREKRTYEFKINMENHLPKIVHMDTYADEPHTLAKIELLRKKAKEMAKKAKEKEAR